MQGPADVFRGAFFMPREARHQRAAGGASFPKTHSLCARAAPSLSPGGKRLRASGAAREIPSSAKRPAMDGRRRLRLRNPPPAEKARHRNKKKLPPPCTEVPAQTSSPCAMSGRRTGIRLTLITPVRIAPLPAPELRPGTIRLRGPPSPHACAFARSRAFVITGGTAQSPASPMCRVSVPFPSGSLPVPDPLPARAPAEHRRAQRGVPLRLLPPPQKPFCSA